MTYLYKIKALGTSYTKVGISDNPDARIKDLQSASPFRLTLVEIIEFPDRESAQKAETFIHHTLKDAGMHLNGEWFDLSGRSEHLIRRNKVEKMLVDGEKRTAIIKEVWGVTNGAAYTAAKAELDSIIESLNGEF